MVGRGDEAKAKNRLGRVMLAGLLLLVLGPFASASAASPLSITSPAQGSSTNQPAPLFVGDAEDTLDAVIVHVFSGEDTSSTQVQEREAPAPSEGPWSVQATTLADGTYTALAQQLDSETAETLSSSPVTFTVDTAAPVLSLNPVGSPTDDSTPTLSGNAGVLPGDAGTVAVAIYAGTVVSGSPVASGQPSIGGFGGWSYTPASLPDGTYTAQAFQGDEAGNVGASAALTFTIDTTTPVVTLDGVASLTNDATPSFRGAIGAAGGDLPSVQLVVHKGSLSGAVAEEGSASVSGGTWSYTSPSLTPDGQYTVQAIQHDDAGNEGKSASATFTLDTTPPTVGLSAPAENAHLKSSQPSFAGAAGTAAGDASSLTLNIYQGTSAVGDHESISISREGSSWAESEGPNLADGAYTAQITQSDSAGNVASLAHTFTIETNTPHPTLDALPRFMNDATPTFSGKVDTTKGAVESVTLRIFRGTSVAESAELAQQPITVASSGSSWSVGPVAHLADGTYTAQVEQENLARTTGFSSSSVLTVDTVPPHLTLTAPEITTTGVETISGVAGFASGDRRQITVELFTGAPTEVGEAFETITVNRTEDVTKAEAKWSATFANLPSGQYTAIARQSDEAGNVGSETGTFTVAVAPATTAAAPAPPVASFAWVPASPTVGQSVSLVSNSTDASSPISAFAWDVAGAGLFAPGGPVMSTSFAMPGPHVVQLRVTDANGQSSVATRTIAVAAATLKLMQPFPIVRIAGSETSNGVRIRLLTVQTPLLATVVVSCKGHGCKTKSERRVATASSKSKARAGAVLLSFKRFQRALRVGAVLQVRVYMAGQIGKFTSFRIRRHRLPLRSDACLRPNSPAPIPCPLS
ncbi:MAG TPA: Ig-like domain-containing protein [Solirubrobacteraceae bacterium]|nr:Ig-like domain-containing protein [Solirubrobacteraceae bacterium]